MSRKIGTGTPEIGTGTPGRTGRGNVVREGERGGRGRERERGREGEKE